MTRGEKLSEGAWRSVRSFIVRSSEKWEAVYQRNHFRTCIPCIEYTLESFAVSLHSSRYVYMYVCARVYVCMCVQTPAGKTRGLGFILLLPVLLGQIYRWSDTYPLRQRDKWTCSTCFYFSALLEFFSRYYFLFYSDQSEAIPNYPSLNIQRMGRKGGTKREEVYYVISFSTGKYGEYAYFQRRGIRIAVYTYSCKRSVFFN